MNPREIISDILWERKGSEGIESVCFVACGGSLTALAPAKSFLELNSKKLKTGYFSSNEFVHNPPSYFGRNSLLITSSHSGNTPETVEAAKLAKSLGASIISMTYADGSPITEPANYSIVYEWGEGARPSKQKPAYVLELALELLHQTEGYRAYDKALESISSFDGVVKNAIAMWDGHFQRYAKNWKENPVIYTMGSGANYNAAHQQSICIFMEMQWIHSSAIHTGEYFHGPFEITEKGLPFILLMSSGPNRPLDKRAQAFLSKFADQTMILDAKPLIGSRLSPDFAQYLEPILFTNLLGVFNKYLAEERVHPLSTRRYMWKMEY